MTKSSEELIFVTIDGSSLPHSHASRKVHGRYETTQNVEEFPEADTPVENLATFYQAVAEE